MWNLAMKLDTRRATRSADVVLAALARLGLTASASTYVRCGQPFLGWWDETYPIAPFSYGFEFSVSQGKPTSLVLVLGTDHSSSPYGARGLVYVAIRTDGAIEVTTSTNNVSRVSFRRTAHTPYLVGDGAYRVVVQHSGGEEPPLVWINGCPVEGSSGKALFDLGAGGATAQVWLGFGNRYNGVENQGKGVDRFVAGYWFARAAVDGAALDRFASRQDYAGVQALLEATGAWYTLQPYQVTDDGAGGGAIRRIGSGPPGEPVGTAGSALVAAPVYPSGLGDWRALRWPDGGSVSFNAPYAGHSSGASSVYGIGILGDFTFGCRFTVSQLDEAIVLLGGALGPIEVGLPGGGSNNLHVRMDTGRRRTIESTGSLAGLTQGPVDVVVRSEGTIGSGFTTHRRLSIWVNGVDQTAAPGSPTVVSAPGHAVFGGEATGVTPPKAARVWAVFFARARATEEQLIAIRAASSPATWVAAVQAVEAEADTYAVTSADNLATGVLLNSGPRSHAVVAGMNNNDNLGYPPQVGEPESRWIKSLAGVAGVGKRASVPSPFTGAVGAETPPFTLFLSVLPGPDLTTIHYLGKSSLSGSFCHIVARANGVLYVSTGRSGTPGGEEFSCNNPLVEGVPTRLSVAWDASEVMDLSVMQDGDELAGVSDGYGGGARVNTQSVHLGWDRDTAYNTHVRTYIVVRVKLTVPQRQAIDGLIAAYEAARGDAVPAAFAALRALLATYDADPLFVPISNLDDLTGTTLLNADGDPVGAVESMDATFLVDPVEVAP